MGHCGRRGVAAVGVDKHFDVVGNEDLKRADHRWFGQRVRITADKQRSDPVFWLLIAVINDGLGGCQDVVLVESAVQRGATVSGGAESDLLIRVVHVRLAGEICGDQFRNIDEIFWLGELPGAFMCHVCSLKHQYFLFIFPSKAIVRTRYGKIHGVVWFNMQKLIQGLGVGAGAALGVCVRLALTLWLGDSAWPILTINVLGAFLMGWLRPNAFWGTGFLGGFTTFSAMMLNDVSFYFFTAVGCILAWLAGDRLAR